MWFDPLPIIFFGIPLIFFDVAPQFCNYSRCSFCGSGWLSKVCFSSDFLIRILLIYLALSLSHIRPLSDYDHQLCSST
ncbi:hypothetical protein FRX31_029314 [Thalictrum thalictroides]|uniref:Uncharacterized protein n=1 Tax=Thalictrum thalictroides TaxID=46969 RepID=A0A7J6V7K5_THATH|nr:hypothetical protein FRX31_029314 [Thalictrum thalictroides]